MTLPIEKAKYHAKAIACSFGIAEKGTHQVGVTVEIVEGDFAQHTITWLGYFTDGTSARTIESLQHMGWKGDDLSELEDLDAEACARLLPEPIEIVCEPDTYNNETRLKVRWVNRIGAGRFGFKQPLAGAALKGFAAQMKAQIRGMRGPQNSKSAPTTRHPNAPGSDDDLPF